MITLTVEPAGSGCLLLPFREKLFILLICVDMLRGKGLLAIACFPSRLRLAVILVALVSLSGPHLLLGLILSFSNRQIILRGLSELSFAGRNPFFK